MKITILEKPRVVMHNPMSLHNYFAWPTVARLKDGRLALAASGFRLRHVCPFGKAVLSFSADEGKTWSQPNVVIDTVLDDRDAGLCPFGKSGLIVTSFNNERAFQRARLQRDGKSDPYTDAYLDKISDEEEKAVLGATFRVSLDNGTTFSPLYRSPVSSPHGPLECADGTLLWVGRAFAPSGEYSPLRAAVIRTDGTSEVLGEIPKTDDENDFPCEPYAVQRSDGSILCHFRLQQRLSPKDPVSKLCIYQTVSYDQGKSWSKPVQINSDLSGAPPHIVRLSDSTLLCTYSHRRKPFGVWFMLSRDEGETWQTDLRLLENGEGWDLGYPSTVELRDHSLLTTYYAHESADSPAVIWQVRWKIDEI